MVFLFWLCASIIVGVIAGSRNRSGFGWFLLSMLISPLLAGILVLALGLPKGAAADAPSPLTHVRCPDCKELVLAEAVKCKHCGTALIPTDLSAAAAHQASSDLRGRLFAIGAVIVAVIILWNVLGGW